jgi:hypothetical protein
LVTSPVFRLDGTASCYKRVFLEARIAEKVRNSSVMIETYETEEYVKKKEKSFGVSVRPSSFVHLIVQIERVHWVVVPTVDPGAQTEE